MYHHRAGNKRTNVQKLVGAAIMSAEVFISFASQDDKVASTICKAIENRGFKCWISTRDIQPGENFQSSIVRAIRGAKVLLLVFTSNSNRSEEMTKELALASQQKLMVVPLRVENVTPSDAFAYEFATRQWIDLFADWERAMNHLCARLTAALADDRTHTDTIVLGKPTHIDPSAATKVAVARRHRLMAGVAIGVGLAVAASLLIPYMLKPAAGVAAGVGNAVAPAAEAAPIAAPAPLPEAAPPIEAQVAATAGESSQAANAAPAADAAHSTAAGTIAAGAVAGSAAAVAGAAAAPAVTPAPAKPAAPAKPKPSSSTRKNSSNLPY
jgi:hypothetical protein